VHFAERKEGLTVDAEPVPEKSVDEVLDEIDWEKLGSQGAEEKAELPLPGKTEPLPPARRQAPLPAQTKLFRHGADIEIVRRWFGWQAVLVTAFTLFWGVVAFSTLGPKIEDLNLLGLLFTAADVALAYYSLALWLNWTRIVVSPDAISVRHGPLPWPGNRKLEASKCRRLYWDEKEYRGKGGTTRLYEVCASTRDGRTVKLLDGFTGLTREQACFVVEELEATLGLRDSGGQTGIFNWLHP
jgi:hypothetical protein